MAGDGEAHGDGPRERATLEGIEVLSDVELLMMILGTGQKGEPVSVLSASLLAEAGGLAGLSRLGLGGLATRAGIGLAKGARLAAALEIGRRAGVRARPERIRSGKDVHMWSQARLAGLEHEELWALCLDGNNGLRAARRVAMGGLHGLLVSARDTLRCALREGASAFVLVHNHPSGDPTPSPQDLTFTERVARAADVVDTPLVDHVVVTGDDYRSMMEEGSMPPPWRSQAGSPG